LVSTKAKHCPGKVFEVAALAKLVKQSDLDLASLLPPLRKIREYAYDIALAVAKYLIAEGLATVEIPAGQTIEAISQSEQFNPSDEYLSVYQIKNLL
jgi:malate dehydrogenase (oxaloacetate-decarboxylating)/malate dehydrogenase (oxaloacetate-decarboxylating)(NADP+)